MNKRQKKLLRNVGLAILLAFMVISMVEEAKRETANRLRSDKPVIVLQTKADAIVYSTGNIVYTATIKKDMQDKLKGNVFFKYKIVSGRSYIKEIIVNGKIVWSDNNESTDLFVDRITPLR